MNGLFVGCPLTMFVPTAWPSDRVEHALSEVRLCVEVTGGQRSPLQNGDCSLVCPPNAKRVYLYTGDTGPLSSNMYRHAVTQGQPFNMTKVLVKFQTWGLKQCLFHRYIKSLQIQLAKADWTGHSLKMIKPLIGLTTMYTNARKAAG